VTDPAPHRVDVDPLEDPRRVEVARRLLADMRGEAVDRLARLAAQLTGATYAQLSMLTDRQVIAGIHGLDLTPEQREAPLAESLCTVTARSGAPLLIDDAADDERVAALPPVQSGLVGAYLGVPVHASGQIVGALCIYSAEPREWSVEDRRHVEAVADVVATELELSGMAAEAVENAVRVDLGFAAGAIGSFDWDLVTDEMHFDARLRDLFGYTDATFVPHIDSFSNRIHPDDRTRVEAAIADAIERAGDYATEYRVVRGEGDVRWVAARGRVLSGRSGRPERMVGAAYDTTAVQATGERVARLLETMTDAFFSVDDDWRFTYVNAQAERLLGRGRGELLGHTLWEEFGGTLGTTFDRELRTAVETGEAVSFEAHHPPLGGWFEARAIPAVDGLSVFLHDISARVSAEVERTRALERLELLSAAGTRLSATLEVGQILDALGDLLLPRFGRWLAVALRDDVVGMLHGRDAADEDALRVAHVAGTDRATAGRISAALADAPVGRRRGTGWERAVTRRVTEILGGAGEPPDAGELLTVALVSRGKTVGALVIGDAVEDHADRRLLADVATRVGVALDNAVLYGAERRAGSALQHLLLPVDLPNIPGIATAARYLPATTGRDIGGDFYIGHELDDGRLLLIIGDVMGHGMQAAARMGQLRAVLTAYAFEGDAPEHVLQRVATRAEDLLDVRMATVLVSLYDPVERRLSVASAGHLPPLIAPPVGPPEFVALAPGRRSARAPPSTSRSPSTCPWAARSCSTRTAWSRTGRDDRRRPRPAARGARRAAAAAARGL
jgi:GAF domain-containing protein